MEDKQHVLPKSDYRSGFHTRSEPNRLDTPPQSQSALRSSENVEEEEATAAVRDDSKPNATVTVLQEGAELNPTQTHHEIPPPDHSLLKTETPPPSSICMPIDNAASSCVSSLTQQLEMYHNTSLYPNAATIDTAEEDEDEDEDEEEQEEEEEEEEEEEQQTEETQEGLLGLENRIANKLKKEETSGCSVKTRAGENPAASNFSDKISVGIAADRSDLVKKEKDKGTNNDKPEDEEEAHQILLVSSIQPLVPSAPSQTRIEPRRASSGQEAGAFSVSTSPPNSTTLLQQQQPNPNQTASTNDDVETGGHHNQQQQAENDDIIQAELVTNDDIVHAERLASPTQRRRMVVGISLIILVPVITLILLVLVKHDNTQQQQQQQQQQPTETASITNTTPCFETSTELFEAVSGYYEDMGPNSSVALKYGWQIGDWCVSNIWDFSFLFKPDRAHKGFNLTQQALNNAIYFSEDLSNWDMSIATHLQGMFKHAHNVSATWGIDQWSTSRVTSLRSTFAYTQWTEPKLNLSCWDTSSLESLYAIFQRSNVDKPGISNWNVSSVNNMWRFVEGATAFDEDLSGWNTISLTELRGAFRDAPNFNSDLSGWITSSLTSQGLMNTFRGAIRFNGDLSTWNVSRVESFKGTFRGASAFNQPIGNWQVSNLLDMVNTFREASSFNQDLSLWDVSSVTDLVGLFEDAANFSHNLCDWGTKLPLDAKTRNMFKGTACPNTSDPLIPGGPFCFNCD